MNSHKDEIRESMGVQNFTHILLQKHETIRVSILSARWISQAKGE